MRSRHERSKLRTGMALAGAFAIGSAGAAVYWFAVLRASSPVLSPKERAAAFASSGFDPFILDPSDPNQPLLRDGQLVTLDQAASSLPFPIFRPHDAAASDDTLTQVWVKIDTQDAALGFEAALRYASGLRAYLTVWPPSADPGAFYRQQVAESGVGSAETINGHPAYVVAANAQTAGFPPWGVVDLSIGNVEISLQGNFSVEDLVRIAASVQGDRVLVS